MIVSRMVNGTTTTYKYNNGLLLSETGDAKIISRMPIERMVQEERKIYTD